MSSKRVKPGKSYRYNPVGLDIWDSRVEAGVVAGDVLEVVNLPGCPPANTMGMCHVKKDGQFVGLVLTNSLEDIAA